MSRFVQRNLLGARGPTPNLAMATAGQFPPACYNSLNVYLVDPETPPSGGGVTPDDPPISSPPDQYIIIDQPPDQPPPDMPTACNSLGCGSNGVFPAPPDEGGPPP